MRHNGTLRYETRTGGGTDDFGEPLEVQSLWSDPIPCLITVNSDNRRGRYTDGEFHIASYTILVEGVTTPLWRRIRLARGTEDLGEHQIIGIVPLTTCNRTQITV